MHWSGTTPCWREQLILRSRQAPISMGFGARLSSTKLTFLSGLGAASGTPHRQRFFLRDFHISMMRI